MQVSLECDGWEIAAGTGKDWREGGCLTGWEWWEHVRTTNGHDMNDGTVIDCIFDARKMHKREQISM